MLLPGFLLASLASENSSLDSVFGLSGLFLFVFMYEKDK